MLTRPIFSAGPFGGQNPLDSLVPAKVGNFTSAPLGNFTSALTAAHDRDLLGQDIVDFDERVDMTRLKRERLSRLQEQMANANLGGMLLFDPLHQRYATGVRPLGVALMRMFLGYTLGPPGGHAPGR